MGAIRLVNLRKDYGKENVIPDLNLDIVDGSFTVLVGPSGCGKSTTLRMIAGLEKPTSGQILIDGVDVANMAPGKRDLAMVFQNYALYPTMSVRKNIEFGLINKKVPKEKRDSLIADVSEIVGLTPYLDRKPANLSGGQRQRVALARAMVKEPKVFLMDEPLSNLDAKLRAQMRTELIALHQRLGTTFVYVTHDQTEAMSMATKIVLMNNGQIQQDDSPLRIYGNPANKFVAQFIGVPTMNVFPKVDLPDLALPADVEWVGFRPSRAVFARQVTGRLPNGSSVVSDFCEPAAGDLVFEGTIAIREIMGSEIIYQATTDFGPVSFKTFNQPQVHVGEKVTLTVDRASLYLFDGNEKRVAA